MRVIKYVIAFQASASHNAIKHETKSETEADRLASELTAIGITARAQIFAVNEAWSYKRVRVYRGGQLEDPKLTRIAS